MGDPSHAMKRTRYRMTRWVIVLVVTVAVGAFATACGGGAEEESSAGIAFDQAFIDAMVPHHESALAMAREAKDAGLREPELIEISDAILETQQAEIEQMKRWRGEWFGSSEIDPEGAEALGLSMDEMGMTHSSGSFAGAADVDATFAAAMIAHHQGAITMAELALTQSERDEIRDLARAIINAQTTEIDRMRPHAAGQHTMHG